VITNREKLISLMTEHNLKCPQVALLLGVKNNTVRLWRTKGHKEIPDQKLELLRFKVN
jgi:DNA-binding transcriptional regulator YiaG